MRTLMRVDLSKVLVLFTSLLLSSYFVATAFAEDPALEESVPSSVQSEGVQLDSSASEDIDSGYVPESEETVVEGVPSEMEAEYQGPAQDSVQASGSAFEGHDYNPDAPISAQLRAAADGIAEDSWTTAKVGGGMTVAGIGLIALSPGPTRAVGLPVGVLSAFGGLVTLGGSAAGGLLATGLYAGSELAAVLE